MYCLFSETDMYILQSQLMLNLFFVLLCCYCREEVEDIKRVIRKCISKKDRQHNGQRTKGHTIYKTLQRKLKIEQYEFHQKTVDKLRCSGKVKHYVIVF